MRLTRRALLILWDYHAWAGALLGLVGYVMVLSGTITLFRGSLEVWEEPIRQQQVLSSPTRLQTDLDLAIEQIGASPEELWITFPDGGRGATSVGYERSPSEPWQRLLVDSHQSRALPEREALAMLLYHLHFLWHPSAPWLYYVAGIAAVGLLFAIVSGVLIHLRGIFRQLYRFRPRETPRTLWSDLHKVLGVVGLPFQTFYAYSGALLVLGPPLVALLTSSHLGVDAARARQWSGEEAEIEEPHGPPCEVRPLDELLAHAMRLSPGTVFRSASIHHHGRETGWVEFEGAPREAKRSDARVTVRLRQRDGHVSAVEQAPPHAARQFEAQLRRLHFAEYGGTPLRFLYAVMGLAAAITILSGNWIWIARRREAAAKGLARLTVGIGAGILVAIAALFAASRILPLDVGRRTSTEELVFGCALFACVAWSLAARNVFALWWKMCALAGGLFFAVPFLAVRVSSAGLLGSSGSRLPAVIGVDLALLLAGAIFVLVARALHRRAMARADLSADDSGRRDAVLPTFRRPARGGPNDA